MQSSPQPHNEVMNFFALKKDSLKPNNFDQLLVNTTAMPSYHYTGS